VATSLTSTNAPYSQNGFHSELGQGFTARTGIPSVALRPVAVWHPADYDRIKDLRAAGRVVGQRREVDHRLAAVRRLADLCQIEQIRAVSQVEAGHLVAEAFQVSGDRSAYVPAVPGDKNAHGYYAAAGTWLVSTLPRTASDLSLMTGVSASPRPGGVAAAVRPSTVTAGPGSTR